MKKLKDIYWILAAIWYIAGAVLNISVFLRAILRGKWKLLIVLAIWWAITLVVRAIRHSIEKRIKAAEEKKLQEYKEKYVTKIEVSDERFGKIVFEYDSNKDMTEAQDTELEKPLGRHNLTLNAELSGKETDAAVKTLGYIYDNKDKILKEIYKYTVEACKNYDERDKDGNMYTLSYVRQNMYVSYIYLYGDENESFVHLAGGISGDDGESLLGCHSVTADIKLNLNESEYNADISCGLEG